MNKNNRRSSLRKAPNNDEDTTTTGMRIKRRISFSGKKSVREFVNTEEPKNWNHSYEVSDHLSAEDNSGSGLGSRSGSGAQALSGENKENVSLPETSVCERSHIDITLNLQTSVDVTLLPCELSKKKHKPLDTVRDSMSLTLEEQQGLRDSLYGKRIMDKTLDVMSGTLVARLQKSVLHNASGGELASTDKIHTTANCMSDSFMDITPLAPSPAAPAPPASQHLIQQSNMQQLASKNIELDMFNDLPNFLTNKENVCPAQRSIFMELEEEEEAIKPVKNKTQHEDVDISFAASLNVSADKDLLPPLGNNISFESTSSGNSTINFKDESVLMPLDMISGKRISKKINFRQLNDELEAGNIQLFPNGPKTPTTDRNSKVKRYWHMLGLEQMDMEEGCPPRDIKSNIKPRGMLNFSESMITSPPPTATASKEIEDKAKDKEKEKDKNKYRFSQADEIMLDNTNFLAHARLGDETQSRNTSKNSTRRETTYDYSELDLERPASRQNFHHPMPSYRPRQSIYHPEEIEADQSESFPAIPAVKTTAPPPPRRTIHQPVEMEADQSLSLPAISAVKTTVPPPPRRTIHQPVEMEADQSESISAIPAVKSTAPPPPRRTIHHLEEMEADLSVILSAIPTPPPPQDEEIKDMRLAEEVRKETAAPAYTRIKTRRRETLLMQVSMEEEEIICPPMELHSESESVEKINSKSRQTLHLAEDLETTGQELPAHPVNPPKSRQNKEEIDFSMKDPPDELQMITKSKQTIDMEEEEMHPNSKELLTPHPPPHKSRRTIIMSEAIEEDKSILLQASDEPSLQKYKAIKAHPPQRPRTRHTLLMAEPIEEEQNAAAFKSNIPVRRSPRSKPRNTILFAEPIIEDLDCKSAEGRPKSESMQLTLVGEEERSNTKEEDQISSQHLSKKIHLGKPEERAEQGMDLESPASKLSTKPRRTIIKPEPIEEIEIIPHSEEQSLPYLEEPIKKEPLENVYHSTKPRKTIIKSEPMEEEEPSISKHKATEEASSLPYRQTKSRQTLVKTEPIEEDKANELQPNYIPSLEEQQPRPKSRNTILVAEEIFEDLSLKSINKPASLDYASPPQETMPKPDLEVITPMRNPRLTSLYRDHRGIFTPGMSLTEFEDQEEMCKTPLPVPKQRQRQRSIYHPEKMETTSGFGTPLVSQANQKRLPKHLTPNLPESKKRHTQLFASSQMEMEMEVDMDMDSACEGANIALEGEAEAHKFLPSFRINHFDETVQPVRDYHPSLTQLGHGAHSLVDVLPQPSELEEKPITISDVSNYFLKEKQQQQEEQRKSSDRESGSSNDRTFKSYAVAHTKFINISGDTTIFAGAIDVDAPEEEEEMEEEADDEIYPQNQIDNEQISLVSTLAEETVENEQVVEDLQPDHHQPDLCQAQITPLVIAGSSASCRKCGNCNRSLSETTRRSSDSFMLPQLSLFEFTKDRQRLRRQRLKPSFEEMQKHWQVRSQETELNESLDETKAEERLLFHWDKAKLMQKLKLKSRPKTRRNRDTALVETKESFFDRLDRLLANQQPNWIFDFQLKASRQLIFYHRLLTTFRIVVNYNVQEDESAIRVCSVAEDKALAGGTAERWTTFEHYLNFQLSLKMPPNLADALAGSDEESFRKFLQRIDQIVVGIKRTFHKLQTVLTATNVRLLRQSNRIFVRKTVLKCIEDEPLVRFERTNFDVQIANVEETCFTDILQPELYMFKDNLQFLPKGIAFLEAFLPNPEQYLKAST